MQEVLDYFHTAHHQFMEMVEGIPEEELLETGRYAFIGKGSLYHWLGAYAAHDKWGKTAIRKWLKAYNRLERKAG